MIAQFIFYECIYWFCKRYIYIINIKLRRKFTYDLFRRNIIDSHICSCEKKRYHVFFSLFVENILIFDCLFRHNGCPLVTGLLESCFWALTVKCLLWTFWWPFVPITKVDLGDWFKHIRSLCCQVQILL